MTGPTEAAGARNKKGGRGVYLLFILGIAALVVVLPVATFHALPLKVLTDLIEKRLESRGLKLSGAFSREFPLKIEGSGVSIRRADDKRLLEVESFRARLNPAGLFFGRALSFEGRAGHGRFHGTSGLGPLGKNGVDIALEKVGLSALSFLKGAWLSLDGSVDGKISLRPSVVGCYSGKVALKGSGGRGGISLGGLPLPLGTIDSFGADVDLNTSCTAQVERGWIESSDLSARITGTVPVRSSGEMDLRLELVPKEGLKNKEQIIALLSPFMRSPNFYTISIKGTPERPKLSR